MLKILKLGKERDQLVRDPPDDLNFSAFRPDIVYCRINYFALASLLSACGVVVVVRRFRPRIHRAAIDAGNNNIRRTARGRFCGAALPVRQGNL